MSYGGAVCNFRAFPSKSKDMERENKHANGREKSHIGLHSLRAPKPIVCLFSQSVNLFVLYGLPTHT